MRSYGKSALLCKIGAPDPSHKNLFYIVKYKRLRFNHIKPGVPYFIVFDWAVMVWVHYFLGGKALFSSIIQVRKTIVMGYFFAKMSNSSFECC